MPVYNQSRSRVVQIIFVVVFVIISAQLLHLQIFSAKYRLQAENNARYRKVIYPDRGIIYDRKKRAVLENTIMYDLVVTPGETRGTDTSTLCSILGIDSAEFRKRLLTAVIKNTNYKPSIFEPLLSARVYARLNENMYKFPGFVLQERPVRSYPFNTGANVLGYIGEVDTNFLKRHKGEGYEQGDYAGLAGLERTYEKVLMGQRGIKFFIRDNRSRIQGAYEGGVFDTTATAGRSLYTSLDVDMQKLAEKLMTNKVGSVVAINCRTGGILAMASGPSFDPNMLTGSERRHNYGRLVLDTARPLFNRAIKGQYPPGSTFKPIDALVALNEHVITPHYGFDCRGGYAGCGGVYVHCLHKDPGHAANLRIALAHSCNGYFSDVFRKIIDNRAYPNARSGYTKWREYMNGMGLGVKLGVDLPSEDAGNIPAPARYDKDFGGARWNSCNIVTLGIGQDRMLATPLQLANAACIIANKGYYYTPHVVDSIEHETEDDSTYVARFRIRHSNLDVSDSAYNAVIAAMADVTEGGGTASAITITGHNYCAKTGTAQNPHGKEHSIFMAFAPRENPQIAVAVVVENAGHGSTWAGPIAGFIMEKYLNDTLAADKLPQVEQISQTNLLPPEIKAWYYRRDSSKAARAAQLAQDENAQPALENNVERTTEHPKVNYDPEVEHKKPKPGDTGIQQHSPALNPQDRKRNNK